MLRRQGSPSGLALAKASAPPRPATRLSRFSSLRWFHSDYFSAATVQVSQKVSEGSK